MANPYPHDRDAMAIYHLLAPPRCPADVNQAAFAILTGAAAAAAARYTDELDLGADLPPAEVAVWFAYVHLLMRTADAYTWLGAGGIEEALEAARGLVQALEAVVPERD